jgi:hypothetical protein
MSNINKNPEIVQEVTIDQDDILELEKEVFEEKSENKWLKILSFLLFSVLIIAIVGSVFIGFKQFRMYKDNVSSLQEELADKTQELSELNSQVLLNLQETSKLKDESAKKAGKEAQDTLNLEKEKQADSKKYAVADKKNADLPGLNIRKTPCGEIAGSLRVWGSAGEVVEKGVKPGACLGGDYEWYKIKWNDGAEGWSIADYLVFSGSKQVSNTGYITGYVVNGYDFDTKKSIQSEVCAINLADNIRYCNAEVNLNNSNYKIKVPSGEYNVVGKINLYDYEKKKIFVKDGTYSNMTQCLASSNQFPGYGVDNINGIDQECFKKWDQKAVVKVSQESVVTNIDVLIVSNPLDFSNMQ